ncbi:hypothetical protein [Alkalitalea saponilacus]|uniref:Beta-galactosidase n=1 Tax=Alkalitalea saponilacus TaxID=889453 RepID=A0A1T5HNH2_9BACT|nr:hypothetical protein [Alkalitalea saponilacus]ASB49335.1 hypothetical protein CDL62_09370 [Alkalitalea saponilacus]SKC22234.1 hypothetical protein SAMN03080601_02534 [Alkalitalea saponilacus]
MKLRSLLFSVCGGGLLLFSCCEKGYHEIRFDSSKEVSGKMFALKDISPGLPENWDEYNYVILEFMITTPQRFNVGFTTNSGYNELRVMSYTPNGWNRLAIPLKFYRELPGAWHDLAGMYNQPRYTGWINLGEGDRGSLQGVDSIGIRMRVPIGDPVFKIRSVSLSVDDPGDVYLGETPVVDQFGQWNLGDWDDKIYSLEQLREEWEAEALLATNVEEFNYSKFGGYLNARYDNGTGFFRVVETDGRWWFVDPEGYLFLSHGVDCVTPGAGGNAVRINHRPNLYKELPPEGKGYSPDQPDYASFGTWNLVRRYGKDFREPAIENIFKRMNRWGLNTIANWSDREVMMQNRVPFMTQLGGLGIDGTLMGLVDVYDPDFNQKIDEAVKRSTAPFAGNPWLIGYFTGNEPSWQGLELRVVDIIHELEDDRPIKKALVEYLSEKDSPERRVKFVHETFRTFIKTVDKSLKRHSPGHLNLGIRFGGGNFRTEILDLCKGIFDVFSFNSYTLTPEHAMMDSLVNGTGMPLLIGEYHFGTVDRGMSQSLWQVDTQEERGIAYRYYTEQAFSHPALIGTGYFQWGDQDLTGRGYDGENLNCGIIDVTDRPYQHLVNAISETSKRLYQVHKGEKAPFNTIVERARGYERIPDLWNE